MKWITSLTAVLALSVAAYACDGSGKDASAKAATGKTCCDKNKTMAAGKDKAGCHGGATACAMPAMQYKVGDEVTNCPKAASEMAKGDESKISYVVAGKDYTDKSAALKAYAAELENHLRRITNVSYAVGDEHMTCPMEAAATAKAKNEHVRFRVAALTFTDRAAADKASQAASEAAKNVTLMKVVDGKEYPVEKDGAQAEQKTCSAHGDATAMTKCEYKVGETKTSCPLNAQVELQKARIAAALKALEAPSIVQAAEGNSDGA